MKRFFEKIAKYIVVFIILFIIFNFALYIISLFPSSTIEKNVKRSSEILLQEGNSYELSKFLSIRNNNYTDAIIINEAYSIDNTKPIYSYMTMRKNYNPEITKKTLPDTLGELASVNTDENGEMKLNSADDYDPVGELNEFMNGKIDTSIIYARYWHGYMPVYRVLLVFLDIMGIRILLLIIFILVFIYLMYLLKNKLGIMIAVIFGYALITQGYFFVSYSLESSPVFLVMMISSIILLKRIDKIKNIYMYFFIIAIITNFVDYLTVPLITLAMPLFIYISDKQKKEHDCKKYVKIIVKATIIWFLGYALMWASKWMIYDFLYHGDLIKTAIQQILYRTERYNPSSDLQVLTELGVFLISNIQNVLIFYIILLQVRIVKINQIKVKLKNRAECIKENIPFLMISLMPFVWYIALANHTILHHVFVYRHMLIFLCGILICIRNVFVIEKKNTIKEE